MKARRLTWAPLAHADLSLIKEYLRREVSTARALAATRGVQEAVSTIRENPHGWEARPEWGKNVRRALSRPYVIVYEVRDGREVVILRIFHGAQHIDAIMRGGEPESSNETGPCGPASCVYSRFSFRRRSRLGSFTSP